jgi:hypothetical protein
MDCAMELASAWRGSRRVTSGPSLLPFTTGSRPSAASTTGPYRPLYVGIVARQAYAHLPAMTTRTGKYALITCYKGTARGRGDEGGVGAATQGSVGMDDTVRLKCESRGSRGAMSETEV